MKIGRNDPCPCGSGEKYKRCCGGPHGIRRRASPTDGDITAEGAVCAFACSMDCSEWCCGGATLITLEEIKSCYDIFPITVGFRKYLPLNPAHRALLDSVGMKTERGYVVGDFVAGNRFRKRCMALDNEGLCRLHKMGRKPAQCRLVPFCALYPEESQAGVFAEQKGAKFSQCRGFRSPQATEYALWKEGRFIDGDYRRAFHDYQRGLKIQKPLMEKIFEGLRGQRSSIEFLKGEGILEVPIAIPLLFDVLEAACFSPEGCYDFLREQSRLCHHEVAVEKTENSVLGDYLSALRGTVKLYAEFLRKQGQSAETGEKRRQT